MTINADIQEALEAHREEITGIATEIVDLLHELPGPQFAANALCQAYVLMLEDLDYVDTKEKAKKAINEMLESVLANWWERHIGEMN